MASYVPPRPDAAFSRAHELASDGISDELVAHSLTIAGYVLAKAHQIHDSGVILFGDPAPDDAQLVLASKPTEAAALPGWVLEIVKRFVLAQLGDPEIMDRAASWIATILPDHA
jgi:hypothetical protein